MSVTDLLELLQDMKDEGKGNATVMIPSQTGGEYSPSAVYESGDNVTID